MPRTARRQRNLPRSRQELRSRSSVSHSAPPACATCAPATLPVPIPVAPVVAPVLAPIVPVVSSSGCLYSPYECSVYRYPPQWCSSCQVRAASMCAQLGQPDIRMVFRQACPSPVVSAYQPACMQQAACPTSIVSSCPLPTTRALPASCPASASRPPDTASTCPFPQ